MAQKTTTRKKKVKRSFTKGVAHIHSTFNNLEVPSSYSQWSYVDLYEYERLSWFFDL